MMSSISILILGLFVASVGADENAPVTVAPPVLLNENVPSETISTIRTTTSATSITSITSTSSTSSSLNPTISTVTSSTTQSNGDVSLSSATPKPMETLKTTKAAVVTPKSTAQPVSQAGDSTGIIILIIIIIVFLAFGVACYVVRKRARRYSVDFTSRPDEANIPLSVVDPELPVESVPQNGLQTFESVETTEKEPQETEAKPEEAEEQKDEADKSVVDPSAESVAPTSSEAPAPSAESSEDKPKADVEEPSPPAPVEPSSAEKTDDEGAVSNKTSVESLKETNENNSNNVDFSQKTDAIFWDVPLNCPV